MTQYIDFKLENVIVTTLIGQHKQNGKNDPFFIKWIKAQKAHRPGPSYDDNNLIWIRMLGYLSYVSKTINIDSYSLVH